MSTKSTAPISSATAPVRLEQSDKSSGIKQTETKKAPKLDKEGQIKALFTTRKNVMITIKAAFQKIGSDKTIAQIKTEIKADIKAQFLDRFDQKERANSKDGIVRNWPTKNFAELGKTKQGFPFEMSKSTFKENTKLLLSVQFDSFIAEAKKNGAKTNEQIHDYVSTRLDHFAKDRLTLNELQHYDRDVMLSVKDQFKTEGRSLKSDILHSFIITMDELSTKSGSIDTYDAKAKKGLGDQVAKVGKDPRAADAFMRGKETDGIGIILFAHGMKDLAKDVERGIGEINKLEGFADLPGNVQLRNVDFKKESLTVLNSAVLKIVENLQSLEVPDDLKEKMSGFSQVIKDKVRTGELSAEMGNSLIHKFFNNSVILRMVNPSLNSSDTAAQTNTRQLNLLTQFVQLLVNGIDGNNPKQGFGNQEAGTEFNNLAGPLRNRLNEVLVDKFGMPDDAYNRYPEVGNQQQVANPQNQQEPPTFEQYLAMQRQPVGGNQGNNGNPQVEN